MIEVVNIALFNDLINWTVLWWMVTGFGAFPVISVKEREGIFACSGPDWNHAVLVNFHHVWSPEVGSLVGRWQGAQARSGCWQLRVWREEKGVSTWCEPECLCEIKHSKPITLLVISALCVWGERGCCWEKHSSKDGMVGLCISSWNVKMISNHFLKIAKDNS